VPGHDEATDASGTGSADARGGPGAISTKCEEWAENLDELLRRTAIFRRLTGEDRQRLADVATIRRYDQRREVAPTAV